MFKEETLGGSQLVEHVPVTVEELRSHFEALGGRKVRAWDGADTPREGMESSVPSLTPPLGCALLGTGSTGLPWMSCGLFASVC